jgi:hypothetical protein
MSFLTVFTSYDLKKMDEMLAYYANVGCDVKTLAEFTGNL